MTRTVALLSVLALAYFGQCDTTTVVSVSVVQKSDKTSILDRMVIIKKVNIYINDRIYNLI